MKQFHWHKVEALREWKAGDLLVMAESLEKAVKIVQEDEEVHTTVKKEIRENPEQNLRVYEEPKPIQIWGSE